MKHLFKFFAVAISFFAASVLSSCGEEELEFDEQISLSNITATAYNDGSITISGTVEANSKLKTFELQDFDGNRIVDLMSDQLKVKGEDGNKFSMNLTSANVNVQRMLLVAKTKGGKEAKQMIGEEFRFALGYGSKSVLGSYVSIVDGKSYTMGQLSDPITRAKVEFALSDERLIPASKCKLATDTPEKPRTYDPESFAKSAIYEGTIITSTGCIATYKLVPDDAMLNGEISGVVIKTNSFIKVQPASGIVLSK